MPASRLAKIFGFARGASSLTICGWSRPRRLAELDFDGVAVAVPFPLPSFTDERREAHRGAAAGVIIPPREARQAVGLHGGEGEQERRGKHREDVGPVTLLGVIHDEKSGGAQGRTDGEADSDLNPVAVEPVVGHRSPPRVTSQLSYKRAPCQASNRSEVAGSLLHGTRDTCRGSHVTCKAGRVTRPFHS